MLHFSASETFSFLHGAVHMRRLPPGGSARSHRGVHPHVLFFLVLLSTARCDATTRHSPRARAADTASACPACTSLAHALLGGNAHPAPTRMLPEPALCQVHFERVRVERSHRRLAHVVDLRSRSTRRPGHASSDAGWDFATGNVRYSLGPSELLPTPLKSRRRFETPSSHLILP